MSKLLEKMLGVKTKLHVNVLSKSELFNNKDCIPTAVPIINIALSGDIDKGLVGGTSTMIAGPSKHFKTNIGLLLVSSYMSTYSNALCLFYDNEFGSTPDYFKSFGIDTDRVVHIPLTNIEEMKFDIKARTSILERGDKVIIFVDSIGNIASLKEVQDAENEKSAADMTRAKSLKSFFRIIQPELSLRDIPMIVINHTYKSQDLFPTDVVSGGTGAVYNCTNVFIISRTQDKDKDKVLNGYTFNIIVDKSRYVIERSKLPLQVSFDGGINKYSGIVDLAIEFGAISKTGAWYCMVDTNTGEVVDKCQGETRIPKVFLDNLLADHKFKEFVRNKYKLAINKMVDDTEIIGEDL